RFRDLGNLQGFALQLWMYATPVIYPVSLLPINMRVISIVNPMAPPVTTFRNLWLGTPMPDPMSWIFGAVFTAAARVLGMSLVSHTQRPATETVRWLGARRSSRSRIWARITAWA